MGIELREIDPRSDMGRTLIAGSSEEQIVRYGRDGGRTVDDLAGNGTVFIAALLDGRPVGCGAIVPVKPRVAELSRIFVYTDARRRGVASAIMRWIDDYAASRYDRLILETGVAQQESVALYEAHGYARIPCWGKSADNPRSLCYQKLFASAG